LVQAAGARRGGRLKRLSRIGWALILGGCIQASSTKEAPVPTRRSPPFLILHDCFGDNPAPTPSYIRDHRNFLESQPFDGLAVYLRKPDLTSNVSAAVLGRQPVSAASMIDVLAPLRGLALENLTENFAAVVGGCPPDFVEDWSAPIANFSRLARAARETGLRGVLIDNESYGTPWANYPRGVLFKSKPLREYQDQARLRGRQVMEAMVSEFPGITVILLHGPYLSEPTAPAPLFPAWQSSNELLGPFFAGFVEGAGALATVVDGGELYHLRTEEQFRMSFEWRKRVFPSAGLDCAFVPAALRVPWEARVSVGFGIIDRPFHGQRMDPGILATTLARALGRTDGYVWLYVEGPTFLRPHDQGGASDEWVEAVRGVHRRGS